MKIITGLGNPGLKYQLTRHNAGFMILDYIAEEMKLSFKAGKGDYYYSETKYRGEKIMFIKPMTYMNNSGLAIMQVLELNNEIRYEDILVVYDDFQLKLGTIRIRERGSDGGHNGISSIIYHLKSMEFPRMRVGIGRGETMKKDEFVDFVLTNFEEAELDLFRKMMPIYKECVFSFICEPMRAVMNRYNKNFIEDEKPTKNSDDDNSTERS